MKCRIGVSGRGGQDEDVGSPEVVALLPGGDEVAFDEKNVRIRDTEASIELDGVATGEERQLGIGEVSLDRIDLNTDNAGILGLELLP